MRELLEQTLTRLDRGEVVIWCVILSARGSTPRGPGAKMAVFADGAAHGTVGGGAVELQAIQFARTLCSDRAVVRDYDLYSGGSEATGMVCGGWVQMAFLPLGPEHAARIGTLLGGWDGSLAQGGDWWLELVIDRDGAFSLSLRGDTDLHSQAERLPRSPTLCASEEALRFLEPLGHSERVYVFGGGHVSAALVPVLLPLGFPVTVLDPRPELAVPERFPGATVLRGDFAALSDAVTLTQRDYAVVMTPGHEMDLAVLRQVLRTPACYVGCIGSRRKTAYVNQKLREEGFGEADLARVHAPIGLPIQARTPEEIAVSIAAELILHRAKLRAQ